MRKLCCVAIVLALAACSGGSTNSITPNADALRTANAVGFASPAPTFTIYGSPASFRDAGTVGFIEFDGTGQAWAASASYVERRSGNNVEVLQIGDGYYRLGEGGGPPARASDGNIYMLYSGKNGLGLERFTPAGSRSLFPINRELENDGVRTLFGGSDGNLYAVLWSNTIPGYVFVKFSTYGSILSQRVLSIAPAYDVRASAINTSNELFLWADNSVGNGAAAVYRLSEAGALLGTYPEATNSEAAGQMTIGPDGNVWLPINPLNCVQRIIVATGQETCYALPAGSHPSGITSGNDGNLWFSDSQSNKIGRMTTAGVITEITTPISDTAFMASPPKTSTANPATAIWASAGSGFYDLLEVHF